MAESKPVVLIVVRRPPLAPEAIATAEAITKEGSFRPVIATERAGLQVMRDDVRRRFELVGYDGAPIGANEVARTTGAAKESLRETVNRVAAKVPLAALALSLRSLTIARRQVLQLLDRTAPAAVIVFDDRAPGHPMLLVHEARRRGIASIFLPFAASTVESDLMLRTHKLAHQVDCGLDRYIKRAFARAMPFHVHQSPDGRFLFFPWPMMAALSVFGVGGTRPWVMGGGETSLVGAFSEQEQEEIIAHGVDPERVRPIGQPSTDALFRAASERQTLRAELGVEPGAKLVICAVPQTAEHGMSSWEDHRRTSEALFRALTSTGAAVLLSLHPKSRPETYQAAADKAGARIVLRPLAEILPAADVFVANFSSTVRWAAALGIPTVIADLSRFRYTMYNTLTRIPLVESVPEVKEQVRRLVLDDAFRAETARELAREAAIYSTLDGQVWKRLATALHDLAAEQRKAKEPVP